jgi:hypothetical protein
MHVLADIATEEFGDKVNFGPLPMDYQVHVARAFSADSAWEICFRPFQGADSDVLLCFVTEAEVIAEFREYRAGLGPPVPACERHAGQLLDALGLLLQNNEALAGALEEALHDRDAALLRVDMLHRELDQLRAANAEPVLEVKRGTWLGIATVVVSLLVGVGGYAAATAQATATERAARIAQETALTQTVVEKSGTLPTDPVKLAQVVRQTAESLRLSCAKA